MPTKKRPFKPIPILDLSFRSIYYSGTEKPKRGVMTECVITEIRRRDGEDWYQVSVDGKPMIYTQEAVVDTPENRVAAEHFLDKQYEQRMAHFAMKRLTVKDARVPLKWFDARDQKIRNSEELRHAITGLIELAERLQSFIDSTPIR